MPFLAHAEHFNISVVKAKRCSVQLVIGLEFPLFDIRYSGDPELMRSLNY
jgi:hypothetical protein